jgi:cytochrome c biogenesis protein CcdA
VNSTRLALAFTAGMITTVNPCGFALLPAYLTYFLGLDRTGTGLDDDGPTPVVRALWVSLAVTLGFVTVFGIVGLVWSSISSVVAERLPYVTMVVGVGLVVLGVAVVRGFEPVVRLPKVQLSREGRELSSMFLYGVTYAVASLSCSIGVFISIVSTTLDDGDVLTTLATFIVYALGMGAALAVLTVSVALARTGVVTAFRRVLPHVQVISGVLMVLAGIFVTYYAWVEVQELNGAATSGVVRWTRELQSSVQGWIEDVGAARLAAGSVVILAAAVLVGTTVVRGRTGRSRVLPDPSGTGSPDNNGQ